MNQFVRASPDSEAIKNRKLKKLLNTLATIVVVGFILWAFGFVWSSDLETRQAECNAWLHSCR